MATHTLSKSTYIRGLQCHKSLYLYKNRYFLRDRLSAEQLAKFKRGTDVGVLARELFPGGVDLSPGAPSRYEIAIKQTQEHVLSGTPVIYEASFRAHQVLILLDILVRDGDQWIACEVKSSRQLSATYYEDAALQYWVMRESGLDIKEFRLIHVNPDYVLQDGLELESYFKSVSVLEEVEARYDAITSEVARQIAVTRLSHSPAIPIGKKCFQPYACDFIGHCWKNIPSSRTMDLSDVPEERRLDWIEQGWHTPADIPLFFLETREQQIQHRCHISGNDFIDKEMLTDILQQAGDHAILFSMMSAIPAVPLQTGTRPYEPLPYAYALLDPSSGAMIDSVAEAPTLDLWSAWFRSLMTTIPAYGKMLVFDKPRMLRSLAALKTRIPESARLYDHIASEATDLMTIFTTKAYYPANLKGDYSLSGIMQALGLSFEKEWQDYLREPALLGAAYLDVQARDDKERIAFSGKLQAFQNYYLLAVQQVYQRLQQAAQSL